MKKILAAIVLAALASTALAQHHHSYPHYQLRPHYQSYRYGLWVAPVITGAVVYDLYRPQPVYVQPAPIYLYPSPAVLCSDNRMVPPRGYRYEYRYDADMGCTQVYFVPY
jgi:hypothetical protein